jgi:aspartate/methionine/tyrosine aminotransferase
MANGGSVAYASIRMPSFSARSHFAAAPNRLSAALAHARESGRPLCDLTESNPTRVGLCPSAHELTRALSHSAIATYAPEPFGLLSARAAIARGLARFAVDPACVLLTASTSEAYSLLFKLLCEVGDEVLVPAPSYPLFAVLAQLEQVRLVPYPLCYDGEWHIDQPALRSARTDRTRAVITLHPNNPTGSYLKRSELSFLAELALPIISDEVFAEYPLTDCPERAASALEAAPHTLVFRLGGLSKSCALPQLKLAWCAIAGPAALQDDARARLEHMADAYLSPSTPVQLALPELLRGAGATRARILTRVRENLALLQRALAQSAASVLAIEGGWYAIVRLPALLDDEEWALRLLAEDGLLVQPGYYYELAGTHLVVSLLCEPQPFAQGIAKLAARVAALSG